MSLLLSVASCTDDYTDWSDPQHNDQPATVQFGNGSVTEVAGINLADVTTSTVKVASIEAPTSDGGYTADSYKIALGDKTYDISAAGEMNTADLQQYITDTYGKAPEQRDIDATVSTWLAGGKTTVKITSGTFKVKATPKAANIEQMYYLAGDMFAGGYTKDVIKTHAFTHSANNVWDDPTFKMEVTTTADEQTFMIVPASSLDNDNVLDGAYGCQNEGDDSANGTLVSEGAQKIVIAEAGKYIITVNMESLSYTVEAAPTNLFLTGSNYNWGTGEGAWKQLIPVASCTDQFWTMIYLHAGEKFKFAPQEGWGGDFGFSATVNDVAGAGITGDSDGNCVVANAGWYLLHVTNGLEKAIEVLSPDVYLIGASVGAWSIVPAAKFTAPDTEDGDFVSPAFVADDEKDGLRMCVVFSDKTLWDKNWWQSEFIIRNGKIDYRGRDNDQYPRVPIVKGQKAYVNFATGTGEIK